MDNNSQTHSRHPLRSLALSLLVLVLLAIASGCGRGGLTGGSAPVTATVADPAGRGDHPVGYREQVLTDPDTGADLVTSVWYPADPSSVAEPASYDVEGFPVDPHGAVLSEPPVADGRFPLIVFSHGSWATRVQSSFLTETLASHGFVVAALDHPGDGLLDALSGGSIEAHVRNAQVSAVIDAVLAGEADGNVDLAAHVDGDRIGLTGHSYGGSTSVEVAAGSDNFGSNRTEADERIDAIAPLAPGPAWSSVEQLAALDIPVLVMGAELDRQVPDPSNTHLFETLGTPDRYNVVIHRAHHLSFSIICEVDDYLTDPTVPEEVRGLLSVMQATTCQGDLLPAERAQAIINRYVVAFFGAHLAGVDGYESFLEPTDDVDFADDGAPRSEEEPSPEFDDTDGHGDPYAPGYEGEVPGADAEDVVPG